MTLAEKMAIKSDEVANSQEQIVEEIVGVFRKCFESGKFEDTLSRHIEESSSAKIKREYSVPVEFWSYHDGCSDTNFHVLNLFWNNPENPHGYASTCYKGHNLNTIQKPVGTKLVNLTEYYLKEMGFSTRVEDKESWLNYFHKEIVIKW